MVVLVLLANQLEDVRRPRQEGQSRKAQSVQVNRLEPAGQQAEMPTPTPMPTEPIQKTDPAGMGQEQMEMETEPLRRECLPLAGPQQYLKPSE